VSLPLLFAATLACLSWLIPDHGFPWTSFYGDLAMAAALCAVLVGLVRHPAADLTRWPTLALFAAALATVPLVQVAVGQIRFAGDGAVASLYIAGFSLAVLAGGASARSGGSLQASEALFAMFMATAVVSVWIQFNQWLDLGQFGLFIAASAGRPGGNLAQPNHMATLLVLGLIGSWGLHQSGRLGALGLVLLALYFGFGMAMTQSRSVWVELAIVLGVLMALQQRAKLRLGRGAWLALAVLIAGVLASWLPVVDLLMLEDSRGVPGGGRTQAGTRPLHWAAMVDAIGRQPWFGYGWNQVAVAQSRVAVDHPATGELIEHSHNMLLDLLLWNGVPLGLFVIGTVAWWFVRHLRACRDSTVALLLAAIAAVLGHALLEFPLEYAYFLLPVGFMMGMVEALSPAGRFVVIPRLVTVSVSAAAAVAVVVTTVDYVRAADNLMTLRFESARIGTGRIVSKAPDVVLLSQLREFLRFARTEARVGMPAAQVDWMRDMAERYGYPPVLFRYALAAGLNGQPDQARLTLVRLTKVHPKRILSEAQENWALLTRAHPELAAVPFPPLPP
jgi:O-antigen ligase